MQDEEIKKLKKRATIIGVLLFLFVISASVLAVRIVYLNFVSKKNASTVIPDNLIGEDDTILADFTESTDNDVLGENMSVSDGNGSIQKPEATKIELYKEQSADNERFEVQNMLPGDMETKYFAVKVSHSADVLVSFHAVITEQTKNLADILHIRVTHLENKKVIYDGTFAKMDINGYGEEFIADKSTETVAYYKIEVSLPASTDNRYQAAMLVADFQWIVKDESVLEPPKTEDNSNIFLWCSLMTGSIAIIFVLLAFKRKKRKEEEENADCK